MNNKDFYINNSEDIPIFQKPFWLEIVSNGNWDVALCIDNNKLIAALPYAYKKSKSGQMRIIMPPLTQFIGPFFTPQKFKNTYKELSFQHKILSDLIKQLPSFSYYEQRWSYENKNWLPFYWNGFSQTLKYTYRLNDIKNIDVLWSNLSDNAKRNINSAKSELSISSNNDSKAFYKLIQSLFKRKNLVIPYTEKFFTDLYNVCLENNCGKIFWATNKQNKPVAGIFLVWDRHTCYYLIGGTTEQNNNAIRYLLWNAIIFSSEFVNSFDFEGSMNEGIEHFFRGFNAEQKGYFELTKTQSRLLQIKKGLGLIKEAFFK